MKEIKQTTPDKLEVSAVKPVKKELKFLGSLKPKPGHTCFQLNLQTGEITVAEFQSAEAHYAKIAQGDKSVRKKLIVKENCLYVTALNKKNSIKHFKRLIASQL